MKSGKNLLGDGSQEVERVEMHPVRPVRIDRDPYPPQKTGSGDIGVGILKGFWLIILSIIALFVGLAILGGIIGGLEQSAAEREQARKESKAVEEWAYQLKSSNRFFLEWKDEQERKHAEKERIAAEEAKKKAEAQGRVLKRMEERGFIWIEGQGFMPKEELAPEA